MYVLLYVKKIIHFQRTFSNTKPTNIHELDGALTYRYFAKKLHIPGAHIKIQICRGEICYGSWTTRMRLWSVLYELTHKGTTGVENAV